MVVVVLKRRFLLLLGAALLPSAALGVDTETLGHTAGGQTAGQTAPDTTGERMAKEFSTTTDQQDYVETLKANIQTGVGDLVPKVNADAVKVGGLSRREARVSGSRHVDQHYCMTARFLLGLGLGRPRYVGPSPWT